MHVDDLKISHKEPIVICENVRPLNANYGKLENDDKKGKVT